MLRTLLVPLDGSDLAEQSVPAAVRLSRAGRTRIVLAHVRRLSPRTGVPEYDLDAVAERVRAEGIAAEVLLLDADDDDVSRAICQAAGDQSADLIVMSTHGLGGRSPRHVGDVADQVLRMAEVPVLLIPAACRRLWSRARPLRIVVRLDGPESTSRLVAVAADLADTLILLRVVQISTLGRSTRGYGYLRVDWEAELAMARHYLDLADRLGSTGHVVDLRCVVAEPAFDLASFARDEEADVIAVATHGYEGRDGLMLGSVAAVHIQRAAMPILLTRHVHARRSSGRTSSELRPVAGRAVQPRREWGGGSPLLFDVPNAGRTPTTDHSRG